MPRLTQLATTTVALTLALAGCGGPQFARVRAPDAPPPVEILQLELKWSNVYLLREGDATMLVDAGSEGDWENFAAAMRAQRASPGNLRLDVLTHAHADHSGLAARLMREGVPVAAGRGDLPMAARGRNDTMIATGIMGTLLHPLVDFAHEPFAPEVVVDAPIELTALGLPGVRVVPMPGHTPGSLVVWVGARDVLVGDEILGGWLGGSVFPHSAGEHYYQTDRRANYCNVQRLLDEGAQRFYPGHGGMLTRESVLAWRNDWVDQVAHCPGVGSGGEAHQGVVR